MKMNLSNTNLYATIENGEVFVEIPDGLELKMVRKKTQEQREYDQGFSSGVSGGEGAISDWTESHRKGFRAGRRKLWQNFQDAMRVNGGQFFTS